MAYENISQIEGHISSIVNQDSSVPSEGSPDDSLWKAFINRAQTEYAESNDWEILKKVNYQTVSIGTGYSMASIGLPADYRKLAGPVTNYGTGIAGGTAWAEILPERQLEYSDVDKIFWVQGDPTNGFSLQWNVVNWTSPGGSGATIQINYYSVPTALTSQSQYPVIQDTEFLSQRTIAYVFESRSDPRYQAEEAKAREKLLQLIENSNLAKYSSYVSPQPVRSGQESRQKFRFGKS